MEPTEETTNERPELVPRNYQEKLIKIATKKNSIVFLPTGSGKTFIAVCVVKELAQMVFNKNYSNGGKITLMLVNTVTLVQQHTKYLQQNTPYAIGAYSGEMNVDFWSADQWNVEFNKHKVLVMTSQICLNIVSSRFLDLNKVNLLIFDECHQAVDNHAMRQVMMTFQSIIEKPHVLGLTATLLNGNVKATQVVNEVRTLETTFHAKVATVDELKYIIGYSTNPQERIISFKKPPTLALMDKISIILTNEEQKLRKIKVPTYKEKRMDLPFLDKDKGFIALAKLLLDARVHMNMLGISGGQIATICYLIHLQCDQQQCIDKKSQLVYNSLITIFTYIKELLESEMENTPPQYRLIKYASPQIKELIQILMSYSDSSDEELCGIIFVQRKNTATFLYHIINNIVKAFDNLSYIKPEFIVGYNTNPLNTSREALYNTKTNKKVMEKFNTNDCNLLIASNVIEEGLDVPKCTLVIKFDYPTNYREYIQSKGRARHKTSLYYMMVEETNIAKFYNSYKVYQKNEQDLNDYLIGKNEDRTAPSSHAIDLMYKEVPPYYVINGDPNSAQITMLSATQLIMMYCNSLPTDSYTIYEPNWYLEELSNSLCRVFLELPIVCPILDPIGGAPYLNKKDAKRSAAFVTAIQLHRKGEINNRLLPVKKVIEEAVTSHLFHHWPENSVKTDGSTNKKRLYQKQVPAVLRSTDMTNTNKYLHVIDIKAVFPYDTMKIDRCVLHRLYNSDLCFGFLTDHKLPNLCQFPIYVSAGEIQVNIKVNVAALAFTTNELKTIQGFHYLIFKDVLKFLKNFLIMDTDSKNLLLVPIQKYWNQIDFDVMENNTTIIDDTKELNVNDRCNLVVDEEGYLEKIVTPFYRQENTQYVVLQVCYNLNAHSQFPKDDVGSYADYFLEKYQIQTFNPTQPLLLVKAISSKLNYIKPRGVSQKRRREDSYESMYLHLLPEMCVKQEFPSDLWVQAKLLPTILHRTVQLLRAEELRQTIACEAQLDVNNSTNWAPLQLDTHLLKYETNLFPIKETIDNEEEPILIKGSKMGNILRTGSLNKEFETRIKDSEYPWRVDQEPKDIRRHLDVTRMDVERYSKFIKQPIYAKTIQIESSRRLAINYDPEFQHKPIEMLRIKADNDKGPELADVYQALMTSKCNDIVNMERLETLGDSFLKLVASLFVFLKYPKYTEGQATELKSRLVSNRNLFYLGNIKKFSSYLKATELDVELEWLPPAFCVPKIAKEFIANRQFPVSNLFFVDIPKQEQLDGTLSHETEKLIKEGCCEDKTDRNTFSSMCNYLGKHMIPDKTVADVVEALIGIYYNKLGFEGGLKFLEWLGLFPKTEHLMDMIRQPIANPIINANASSETLEFLMPTWYANQIEEIIGYKFRNRAFLLQAFTHSSYTTNRLTLSYQRLEFIGDAVLDFIITTYIYESCEKLNPGELTDLRSALVNNETFASYVVKLELHKYIKHYNPMLNYQITKFVLYQEKKDFAITDDVLILLNEKDLKIAENVDVPKVLGDIFESIAGAIYLDCGMDLEIVWKVFYKIMWKEIATFSQIVPKNPIRMLMEKLAPVYPTFHKTVEVGGDIVMVKLDFMLEGSKTRVHGFGDNKKTAKKAAAKVALRLLSVS